MSEVLENNLLFKIWFHRAKRLNELTDCFDDFLIVCLELNKSRLSTITTLTGRGCDHPRVGVNPND